MNFFKKIPWKIWILILIIYLIPILIDDSILQYSILEMRWFLYLVPVFFFSYYYGLWIGITSSVLSNLLFLLYEMFETHHGEPVSQFEIYFASSISLVSLFLAICIGLMANKQNRLIITDPLTNLFNRRYLDLYRMGKKKLSILFIDLDRFKLINDSLGHFIGDQILQSVSERLKNHSGQNVLIARLGGDEFVIIIEEIKIDHIKKMARNILQELSLPFHIGSNELYLTASIGISQSTEHNKQSLNELIIKADIAMQQAKLHGKNQYQFYLDKMNDEILEITELEKGLHRAIKHKEFILHYQPKVDLKTNKLIGMEALIRWEHPSSGMISPSKFIPMAEETGLIVPIGSWVMYNACKQNKAWQDAGFPPFRISVNISARQFQSHLASTVRNILKQTGLSPQWLELEITESMLMLNVEEAIQTLKELKNIGVYLSIDDFGTGYSSLNYLKMLPIDCLKIDKSFVDDISTDVSIANAIITLAHNLKMKVIAEGIETQQQAYILQQENCEYGQGYLYSQPVSKEQFETVFLASIR